MVEHCRQDWHDRIATDEVLTRMEKGRTRGRRDGAEPPPVCHKTAANLPPKPTDAQALVSLTIQLHADTPPYKVWRLDGTITDHRISIGQPMNLWLIGSQQVGPLTIQNGMHFTFDITTVQTRGPFVVVWQPKFGGFSALSFQIPV